MEKILNEFREKFDHIVTTQGGFIVGKEGTKSDNCACDLSYIQDWLKEKLSEFEKTIREETIRNVKSLTDDIFKEFPMGIWKWKAYGKKYDYWDYFEKATKEEFLKRILPVKVNTSRRGKYFKLYGFDKNDFCTGHNSCVHQVLENANKEGISLN